VSQFEFLGDNVGVVYNLQSPQAVASAVAAPKEQQNQNITQKF
jgi:hypothetical protein